MGTARRCDQSGAVPLSPAGPVDGPPTTAGRLIMAGRLMWAAVAGGVGLTLGRRWLVAFIEDEFGIERRVKPFAFPPRSPACDG